MRKSITKTIKAAVAFAVAIGAGVGASMSSPNATPVYAADAYVNSFSGISGDIVENIVSYACFKGDGTSNPAYASGYLRIYKPASGYSTGGYITVTAANGYNLTSVTFTSSGDKAGSIKTCVNGGSLSSSESITASGSKTISGISASSVSIYNVGNDRLSFSRIDVTYSESSKANVVLACDDFVRDVSEGSASLAVTATSGGNPVQNLAYTYDIEDTSVATVSNTGVVTPVEIGETELTISFAGDANYNSASKTISVAITHNSLSTSNLTFSAACGGSGTANDGVVWSVDSDGSESVFDNTSGIHYGTNSAEVTYLELSTDNIFGDVKQIIVNARDAQAVASISVSVGGVSFNCAGSATVTATNSSVDYAFRGNARGDIVVSIDRGSSKTKALYVKSIVVYFDKITLSSIALSGTYQTTFNQGGEFNHDGMIVTATFSDASTVDVTSKSEWTGNDLSTAGVKTVTVTYKTKTATYDITVNTSTMYTVGGTISNGCLSSTDSVAEGSALNISIIPDHRFESPTSLTVTMDGNALTNSDYTYNASTGAFSIDSVTGNVVINGECGHKHGYWDDDPFNVTEARTVVNALDVNGTTASAYVEGIISQIDSYNSTYKSITYWISINGVAENQLEVYSGKGVDGADFDSIDDIKIGARVLVTGTLKKYSVSVFEFDKNNSQISYSAPTNDTLINIQLNSSSSIAMINGDENWSSGTKPESIVFKDLGLTNGVQYSEPFGEDNFTVTFAGGGNDGKYYDDGGIRTYGNGTFTIHSSKTITKLVLSFDNSNKPESNDVVDEGAFNYETSVWTGSANTIVFTRPSGAGHWRLKSVRVIYGELNGVGSVKLRLGGSISVESWNAINALEGVNITDYGVMIFRTDETHIGSAPTVKNAYRDHPTAITISRKNSSVPPAAEDGYYSFVTKINITSTANYDMYFCARAFIVINNTDYYFIGEEMQETVKTVAASNNGTNLSSEALAYLAGN